MQHTKTEIHFIMGFKAIQQFLIWTSSMDQHRDCAFTYKRAQMSHLCVCAYIAGSERVQIYVYSLFGEESVVHDVWRVGAFHVSWSGKHN